MSARVTRGAGAPAYHPALHGGVEARRLQGHEAGPTERFWMGESLYRPGGAAQLSPAATETVYYALEGELTLTVVDGDHTEEHVLVPGDSVHLAAGTVRAVLNHTARTARLLVVVAHPTAES